MAKFVGQSADAPTAGTENSTRGTFLRRKSGRSAVTAKKANVRKNTVSAMLTESSAINHATAMNAKTADGLKRLFLNIETRMRN